MQASKICFPVAVVMALAGMAWGIHMAMSQDHSQHVTHAHLNLLGWVSLFLMGLFYKVHPSVEGSRLALLQVLIWIAGTIGLTVGVGMIYAGSIETGDPIAGISSLVLFADMALFGFLVLKATRS